MAEEGYHLKRFNNGSQANRADIYFNLSPEWWSTVSQLIERRQMNSDAYRSTIRRSPGYFIFKEAGISAKIIGSGLGDDTHH